MRDPVLPSPDKSLETLLRNADPSAGWAPAQSAAHALAQLEARLDIGQRGDGIAPLTDTRGRRARMPQRPVRQGWSPAWMMGVAAMVLVAVSVIWHPWSRPSRSPSTNAAVYMTPAGQRAHVTLSDGTRVTLAPASTMAVQGRTVTLDGEALFTVTQQAREPFVVRTGAMRAQVLGTSFAVRAYSTDVGARVVVTEGRVQVAATASPGIARILNASDAVIVHDTVVTPLPAIDLTLALGWTQGKLVWERAAAADVVRDLNRTYGLDIRLVTPALEEREITAVFPSMAVEDMLDELRLLLNARYERRGQQVVFLK